MEQKHKEIFQILHDMGIRNDSLFDDFFKSIYLDEETYILILRNQSIKPHIFLGRSPNNIRTNAFNQKIAHIWHANIDIQFILDLYAIATYCTSYMTKVDKTITS